MPTTSKPTAKSGGGRTFKPPRPQNNKTNPASKRKAVPVHTTPSSDDETNSKAASNSTDSELDPKSSSVTAAGPSNTQDPGLIIPPKLMTKALYHHLEKVEGDKIKIGKEANALVGQYFDTFIREAIARAAGERAKADEIAGTGDGFLEVEDLEKLVPQLLLDF
ncbi:MAG: hypothetical protein Q9169_006409 [Polycauliona sp. 2 TL-2023]